MLSISFLEFILIGMLFFAALAVVAPVVYAIVTKKWAVLAIEAALLCVIFIGCKVFPTQFPYMDGWIIGKDRQTILKLYGQPDGDGYVTNYEIAYDLGPDRGFFGIMSSHQHNYYYIRFDAEGKACQVLKGGPIGG